MNHDEDADRKRILNLRLILSDNFEIFDMGVQKGGFATTLRSISAGKIYLFQPIPEAFSVLVSRPEGENFFPVNQALDSTDGTSTFHAM